MGTVEIVMKLLRVKGAYSELNLPYKDAVRKKWDGTELCRSPSVPQWKDKNVTYARPSESIPPVTWP